jgi:OOP family OmpA-OmpF porin
MSEKGGKVMRAEKFIIAIITLLTITVTSIATAEMRAGAFTVSPHVGGYVFEGEQNLSNGPVYGMGFGYNYTKSLGVEFVFDYVDTNVEPFRPVKGTDVVGLIYRIDALYHLMPDKQLVPYVSAGMGGITLDKIDTSFLLSPAVGFKYFFTKNLIFRSEGRYLLSFGDDSRHNFAYTFGLSYLFGGRKEKPAPPPPTPPPPAPKDSDGDGVNDDLDKCPDTPPGITVDNVGCPKDSDGDGVADYLDTCPGTPSGAAVDSTGCPQDSDGDGVFDYLDDCPDTPQGITVDNRGCPVPIKEEVSIELHVEFAFDRAIVKNIYHDHINKVANFLKAYPDTIAVIEGHTDNVGSEEYNLTLSQKRAENVVKHLIDYGIDPSRMVPKGFGESKPFADNKTEEGRQKNRRVVAVITTIVEK